MEEEIIRNASEDDEVSLKDIILKFNNWFRYLLNKWVVILSFGVLGAIFGFTYAWFKKPIYTATTTFVLDEAEKNGGGLGQYAGLASMVGIDLGGKGGTMFQGDNILELYKSRKMIEKALLSEVNLENRKQLLIDKYIEFNKLREKWSKKQKLKNIRFDLSKSSSGDFILSRLQDSILGTIVKDINKNYLIVSKPDKKLSIIRADVVAEDESFAKAFNEEIVKNVNDFYVQTKTKKSLENIKILVQKTDSVRSVMNGAIYKGAAVADATPNLNVTRQVQRLAPIQRSQFTVETNKAILGELIKNLEMSKMALLQETPLVQVIDKPVFPLDEVKFGKVKGIVFGGLLGGFLIVVVMTIRRIFKDIIK